MRKALLGLLGVAVVGAVLLSSVGISGRAQPEEYRIVAPLVVANPAEPTPTPTQTPIATPTVIATATPVHPTPTQAPSAQTFGPGTHVVGQSVTAGTTYRAPGSPSCYWERLSGFGDTLDEIIANHFGDGPVVVTIGANDAGFSSSSCGTWSSNLLPVTAAPGAPISGPGMYIVGVDIEPGRWTASGGTNSCYWERVSDFSGEIGAVISNDFGNASPVVEIAPTDAGFATSNCGTWSRTTAPAPGGQTFGPGTHVVGTTVTAGTTYRAPGSSSCYWERLRGFGGTLDEIIANHFGAGHVVVTIGAGDAGFSSSSCGTWTSNTAPVTSSPNAPITAPGMYIVGVDIAPGLWTASGGTSSCYWERVSDFSGELSSIIDNDLGDASPAVAGLRVRRGILD